MNQKKHKYYYPIILSSIFLAISYVLPIIFNTYLSYDYTFYEFLKYVILAFIIFIVSNTKNKNIYLKTIILMAVIQIILGIDSLSLRILEPYLNTFNSGYLSKDLDRLSGTLQYANLTGLIILSAYLIVIKYIKSTINNIENEVSKISKEKLVVYLQYIFLVMSIMCIILTKSKMIMVLFILSNIIIFIKENYKLKTVILTSSIIGILASVNIDNLLYIDISKIYTVSLSYILLSVITVRYLIIKLIEDKFNFFEFIKKDLLKLKFKFINKIKLNKVILSIVSLATLTIIIIILFSLTSPIVINESEANIRLIRTYYNLNQNNDIEVMFDFDKDSSFRLIISKVEDGNKVAIENVVITNSEDMTSYKTSYINYTDTKALVMEVLDVKGTVTINEIMINNEKQVLEYLLLPTDIILDLVDVINNNSTSISDRLAYNIDAIKLWNESKMFGLGGEAFRIKHKEVQTTAYSTTEVHNSYLQILVESGIIGFVSISIIVILICKIKTEYIIKLIIIIFIFHSLVDLNFSYLISIVILGILTGYVLNTRKESE